MQHSLDFTRVPLATPTAGTIVHGVACLRAKIEKMASNGSPYLVATLGHRDGQASIKVWSNDLPKWTALSEGDAVQVRLQGKAGSGSFGPEWTVLDIVALAPSHPIRDDLLPACPIPLAELQERWSRLATQLTPAAKALLDVTLDHVTETAYWRAPAAEKMHHAVAPYGLAWHSIEVAELALAMARAIPAYAATLSVDALILGGLLHDIGKVREYDVIAGVGIRRSLLAGARYHTTIGVQIVAEAVALGRDRVLAAAVPQWQIDFVCAVIESHHSIRDHGSPTPPASGESWLIHLGDMASARLDDRTSALRTAAPLDGLTWYRPSDARTRPMQRFDLIEASARGTTRTEDTPAPPVDGADTPVHEALRVERGDERREAPHDDRDRTSPHPTTMVTITLIPE